MEPSLRKTSWTERKSCTDNVGQGAWRQPGSWNQVSGKHRGQKGSLARTMLDKELGDNPDHGTKSPENIVDRKEVLHGQCWTRSLETTRIMDKEMKNTIADIIKKSTWRR